MYKKQQGFTIIEVMIAVVIIAILSAIAVPTYQRSVIRANRTAVQAEMMQVAGGLELFKARQLSYTGASLTAINRSSRFPASTAQPQTYELSLSVAANGITWVLRAVPRGTQQQANDGALAIDSIGRQCWQSGNNAGCADEAARTNTANAWTSR
jgi:type IV pilus assembly protein PilE